MQNLKDSTSRHKKSLSAYPVKNMGENPRKATASLVVSTLVTY